MKIWKPTQEECNMIKKAASLESSPYLSIFRLRLEPGIRYNLDNSSIPESMNIKLVSKLEDWDDTDLSECGDWADFRKGVKLDNEGKAVVDFYIRAANDAIAQNEWCSLFGNVIVEYADERIISIRGCHKHGHDYLEQLRNK